MSGHTPGDWIARPDPHGSPNDFCIGLDDDCSPVDYVAVCRARDARLIAAAPKALVLARYAVDNPDFDSAEFDRMAREFIAEATGEQP